MKSWHQLTTINCFINNYVRDDYVYLSLTTLLVWHHGALSLLDIVCCWSVSQTKLNLAVCYACCNFTCNQNNAHPRGFAIFFFLGGLFPTPGHAERDNSPPPRFWSTLYTFFATSVDPYKRKSTRFHNFYERFPEFIERRIMDVIM